MPKVQSSIEEPASTLDTEVVDKKLEQNVASEPTAVQPAAASDLTEAVDEAEEAPVVATNEEEAPTPEAAVKAVEEENADPEKPGNGSYEPTPTPSTTDIPSIPKPATPVQPAAPPKNQTWASRLAAAAGPPKPVMPVVAPKASTPPAQTRAAPAPKPAAVQPAPSAEKAKENTQPDGWQTAGSDHAKRQNRPQSVSGPPEKEGTMGYVKNVTEKVTADDLRATLSSFGPLIYFDVNRSKVRKSKEEIAEG